MPSSLSVNPGRQGTQVYEPWVFRQRSPEHLASAVKHSFTSTKKQEKRKKKISLLILVEKTSDNRKQVHFKTWKQTNRAQARAQKFERKTLKYYPFGKLLDTEFGIPCDAYFVNLICYLYYG